MTTEDRILGLLRSALTDPGRVRGWYGKVEGDLRPTGEFRLTVDGSGWDGTGRVDACEPPHRLLVTTRESDESWKQGQGGEPFGVADPRRAPRRISGRARAHRRQDPV